MSEVLQANVFFVITSIAVVVLTIFVCIALFYIIRILRNVRDVTDRVREGSEKFAEDVHAVRTFVRDGVVAHIRSSFSRFSSRRRGPRASHADTDDESMQDDV